MDSDSLESLVRRSRDGDVSAFEEIVRRFSRRAVATAHFIAGDLHAGEEAAQDAFVTAWRKLDRLREPAAFRSWFGTILARQAARSRRPAPIPLPPGMEPEAPGSGTPSEESLPREARALKPMFREVLALRYVEGLGYREIAAALGLTVARVKSRLHDGREKLRERLAGRKRRR
jgi:RNA polymerase sigma-70 factor (ECF subfamily)